MVAIHIPGAKASFVPLSTREARHTAASLLEAIDTAEADKIALRGDATRKARRPKRDGSSGLTKKRAVRAPSRLQRVEAAALNLHSLFQDLLGESGAPLELTPNDDISAALIVSAFSELHDALGRKAAHIISKPTGGPSL